MSLSEAIVSSVIIFITAIIVISAAKTTTVTNEVTVDEVPIVWQQRLVHNAINNPYIELSEEDAPITDPDSRLIESAGFVPYTGVSTEKEEPTEDNVPRDAQKDNYVEATLAE